MPPVSKEDTLEGADDANVLSMPNNININITESDSDSWVSDTSSFDDLTDDVYDGYEMIPQTEYNNGYTIESDEQADLKREDFIIEENYDVDEIVKAILDSDLAKSSSTFCSTSKDNTNIEIKSDTSDTNIEIKSDTSDNNVESNTQSNISETSTTSIIEDFADFDNTPIEVRICNN